MACLFLPGRVRTLLLQKVLAAATELAVYAAAAFTMAAQDAPPTTLHVYANLIEIPVLVLSHSLKELPPIGPGKFGLRLDNGPVFRPNSVRREGEDPLVLAVLIDTHDTHADLLAHLDDAMASLVPGSLHGQDRVLLYWSDCRLTRALVAFPASPEGLRKAVEALPSAAADTNHEAGSHDCKAPVNLWDAMTLVVRDLSPYSGRPVLLALTDGHDSGSSVHLPLLSDYATRHSVTIFALTEPGVRLAGESGHAAYLDSLCQSTGGIVLRTSGAELSSALRDFIEMLRERYIIYFPRGNNIPAGRIALDVTVDKRGAFVRPAGIAVEVADPKLYAAPDAVPSDPSKAPVLGSHRMLAPQN